MRKLLLYIFLSCFVVSNSQNKEIDSLLSVLKTAKEDTLKVNILLDIATELKNEGDNNKSIEYSNHSLKLAQQLNYQIGVGNSLTVLGDNAQNAADYKLAIEYYEKALKTFQSANYKKGLARIYNNIGIICYNQSDYSGALKNYFIALEINNELGNKKYAANNYTNIGVIYMNFGNYPEALKCQLATLKLREEISDKHGSISTYNNIAIIYINLKEYDLALQNLETSLKLAQELTDKRAMGYIYNNIGNVHNEQSNYPEALQNYTTALKIRKETNDLPGIASTYANIGRSYHKQNNFNEAEKNYLASIKISEQLKNELQLAITYNYIGSLYIDTKKIVWAKDYLNKSLLISKRINSKEDIKGTYLFLTKIDSIENNYKQAFIDYKTYTLYRDSLVNEDNTKKLVQAQMQYEFDKKEAVTKEQARVKDLELSRNKLITIILFVIFVFVLLFSWLIFRQRKLKSEQKAIQLEQKLLRLQMNPHFIFNSLTAIESFIYEKQPEEAGKYLSDFSRLMRMVLENSREEKITLEQEVNTITSFLRLQQLNLEDTFSYSINVDENLNIEKIKVPPMLFQPFVENAIKHGCADVEHGHVSVSFKQKENSLIIEIADNGKGIQAEKRNKTHKSLATTITKERLSIINSKAKIIYFEIADNFPAGTKVNFNIPIG